MRPSNAPIPFFTLLLGFVFAIATATAQVPAFLSQGLVAYYPFNGDANDESGGNHHGTLMPGATLDSDRFGTSKSAVLIDGINGLNKGVRITDKVINLGQAGYTINLWFKCAVERDFQTLFNTDPHNGIGLAFNRGGIKRVALHLGDGSQWRSPLTVSPMEYQVATWHMATLLKEGDGFQVYVDGLFALSHSIATSGVDQPSSLWLGSIGPIAPGEVFEGNLDDVRIYNRALSESEVKALYEYERFPQPSIARISTAVAQVVNDFVVGATLTDGGSGYTTNPLVTITGGGGSGATATVTEVNGVVTAVTIINPGRGYTSAPTIFIAPPPFPPRPALAAAEVINGFVVGFKITDPGFGYTEPPAVLIRGGGGSGATATATVAGGIVTGIIITNPGIGYTGTPRVSIASPPFSPKLQIAVSRINVTQQVVLGRKYLLESSKDLTTWTAVGTAFVAESEELTQEFVVAEVGQYFRIAQVP